MFVIRCRRTTVSLGGEEALAIQHTTPQALIDDVLREKDNLYRTLARNFPDGAVALFDDSLRYAVAEGAGLAAVGLSNDMLEGKTIWEVFPPEVCALLEQPYRDALNGTASAFEVPFAGRVYHVRALPVRNDLGEIFAGMAIAQDITDRKRMDETLERTGEIQRRRQVAESLREILAILNSRRPLKTILDSIAGQASRLLDAAAIAIYRLEREEGVLRIQAAQGLDAHYAANMFIGVGHGAVGRTVVTRQPTVLPNTDLLNLDDAPEEFDPPRRALVEDLFKRYRALLAVPLIIKEEIYGGIVLYYTEPRQFTDDEIDLAVAFGNQAALAIENARLFAEAQAKAALEERQRLGRELHDSVSQALYGIALGARTARALVDRAPAEAAAPIDYVVSLAQGGLTDMRALIFELRPESLEVEGLSAGLQKQADSLRARHGVEVRVDLCEEPELALDAKEALYRIAQEALHNAVKHARASRVELRLREDEQSVRLEACDNGIGFDASGSFPGHLGLVSMRERAADVEGTLEIESAPTQGTCIRAQVPRRAMRQ